MRNIKIASSWKPLLINEFEKSYMKSLKKFLRNEYKSGKIIYPKGSEYFSAFNLTPFDNIKVVILGQDPYHNPNQAHGLCFSVKPKVRTPASLINIYKEIYSDLGIVEPNHGNLEYWASQGILLLNAVLTVRQGEPRSHRGKGWEIFTDKIISIINEKKTGVIFVLWGKDAQEKEQYIDHNKHYILKAAHPSPLSAYKGFFGCKHFSKINSILKENNKQPIDWKLPEL